MFEKLLLHSILEKKNFYFFQYSLIFWCIISIGCAENNEDAKHFVDFVGDTGDGFYSTFAVAMFMSQPKLEFGSVKLPRGSILFHLGDICYPFASRNLVAERFLKAYELSFPSCNKSISVSSCDPAEYSAYFRNVLSRKTVEMVDWIDPEVFVLDWIASRNPLNFQMASNLFSSSKEDYYPIDHLPNNDILFLAGNHDTLDGGSEFLRLISTVKHVGNRNINETRPYFVRNHPAVPFTFIGFNVDQFGETRG